MANEQNLKPITNSKMARELQEKSVQKRKENDLKRKTFKEEIEKQLGKDLTSIIESMITEAKKGNVKATEFLRDTIGEKPKDIIDANVNTDIRVTLDD